MNPVTGTRPIYIALSCTVILSLVIYVVFPSSATSLVSDNGLIQILTTVLLAYGAALALMHAVLRTPPVGKWMEVTAIMLVYLMREMDFHRNFTSEHVTRIKLYTGPYPLEEKLIGGAVMLAAIAVMAHFTITNLPIFWKKLKAKEPIARNILGWALLLFVSQYFDRLRLLPGVLRHVIEENMELSAALLMVFILSSFSFRKSRK